MYRDLCYLCKMEVLLFQEKNGTIFLANNVFLIHSNSNLVITIGHNINTRGWIVNCIFQDINTLLHIILMILKRRIVTQSSAYFRRLVCDLFSSFFLSLLLSLESKSEHGPQKIPSYLSQQSRKYT